MRHRRTRVGQPADISPIELHRVNAQRLFGEYAVLAQPLDRRPPS
jgi:hypothetical protein